MLRDVWKKKQEKTFFSCTNKGLNPREELYKYRALSKSGMGSSFYIKMEKNAK